jgi:branched-chain amino acid aminotransferase
MDIKKTLLSKDQLKPLYKDASKLPFGRIFTDYMFTMEYEPQGGWTNPEIKPYRPLALDPGASVLHYGQEVFEGQKAYKSPQGEILMFRPRENARRMNLSLRRMCMPEIPEDDFLEAECELVKLEERWIPTVKGAALYIRPTAISTEPVLGVRPADQYLFFIILSPSGPYFAEGFNPVGLWVSDTYTRAALGGTGEAKAGGNYGASLLASKLARDRGYKQVLWLDAREHRYIEEVGAMNIFFVIDNKLVTPDLSGSILRGITRKSVVELAPELGIEAQERAVSIDELVEGIQAGIVTEAFGAGTAAVISPVGKINYKDKEYLISQQPGPWTRKLYDTLTGIQYGNLPDKFGWVYKVR